MKSHFEQIVGKMIERVVVTEGDYDRTPRYQVFLLFTDETYLELYGAHFNCANLTDPGSLDDILDFAKRMHSKEIVVYPKIEET